MKVLYVSDLDGTLLNMNQEVDLYTLEKLNKLINDGLNFTISTGRGGSAKKILENINFKLPVMVLNGTLNYDFVKKEYINPKPIPKKIVLKIMNAIKDFDFKTFEIQTIIDGNVSRFAINKWNKESECIAINLLIPIERKQELHEILSKISGINFFIHKKVYSEGECFCDIVKESVSKASALLEFKNNYGFDKIIAFGDSENDLPLANREQQQL